MIIAENLHKTFRKKGSKKKKDRVVAVENVSFVAQDGLITGFHEPRASHLLMIETLSGKHHLEKSYAAALEEKYQWHEFGDLHLLLP